MKKKGCGFGAIVFGIILFIACSIFLFQNEGRSVRRSRALDEIVNAVEVAGNDLGVPDGTLILVAETAVGNEALVDHQFKVEAPEGSIKLVKDVEMYQWKETKKTDDDKTTYTYEKIWSSSHIDSSGFDQISGHENPSELIYESDTYAVSEVDLGAYHVRDLFISKMSGSQSIGAIDESQLDQKMTVEGNTIFVDTSGSGTLTKPNIGDYKIVFTYTPSAEYTVLGKKSGTEITNYETKNGDLAEVEPGKLSKEALKEEKDNDNKMMTIALRIGLTIGIIMANMLTISPVTSLLGNVPLAGNLVNKGIGLVGGILGVSWSLLVIAAGWFVYRPIISIGLLVIIIVLIVLLFKSKDKKVEMA